MNVRVPICVLASLVINRTWNNLFDLPSPLVLGEVEKSPTTTRRHLDSNFVGETLLVASFIETAACTCYPPKHPSNKCGHSKKGR